jgi:hypothetical protein
LGLVAAVLLPACETVVVSMVEVAEIEVVPPSITVIAGNSEAASAVVRESGGEVLAGRAVTWTVDDPDIATVTSEGLVQGWAPGTTVVRASSEGVSGATEVEVLSVPEPEPDPGELCDVRDRTFFDDVEIQGSCTFTNVRVWGRLELREGASLTASELTAFRQVEANRAQGLILADSRIHGDLKFENGGSVTIRDSYIGKELKLKSNLGAIAVSDNTIGETLTLEGNRGGPSTLLRNASKKLECKGNDPPPTGGGNVVEDNKTGQCVGL